MKKLIIKLALFLLPLTILSYWADVFISKNLSKSNEFVDGEYSVWNDLYNGSVNSDIVILGASNAFRDMDPAIISKRMNTSAYNLGSNGNNFGIQYLRYRLLLKNSKKPKLIINVISAATLEKSQSIFNPDQFLPYMFKNKALEETLDLYDDFKNIDYFFPMIRYFGRKEAMINAFKILIDPSSNTQFRINGYKSVDEPWNHDLEKARIKSWSVKFELDTTLVPLFDKYIKECKEQNIDVVFVNAPEYIEGQDYVENRPEMMAEFHKLSESYQIQFYNYLNDSISYNKKYFFNTGHLNKDGAEYFTSRLMEDIQKSQIKVK
jgi:hypothetical protein